MTTPRKAKCRSCEAQVIWTTTNTGKSMPVDATPNDGGNVLVVVQQPSGKCLSVVHGTDEVVMAVGPDQFVTVSHFATCPQGKSWRHAR